MILISQHITRPDNETGFRLSYDDKRHVILSDIAISRTTTKYSARYEMVTLVILVEVLTDCGETDVKLQFHPHQAEC